MLRPSPDEESNAIRWQPHQHAAHELQQSAPRMPRSFPPEPVSGHRLAVVDEGVCPAAFPDALPVIPAKAARRRGRRRRAQFDTRPELTVADNAGPCLGAARDHFQASACRRITRQLLRWRASQPTETWRRRLPSMSTVEFPAPSLPDGRERRQASHRVRAGRRRPEQAAAGKQACRARGQAAMISGCDRQAARRSLRDHR